MDGNIFGLNAWEFHCIYYFVFAIPIVLLYIRNVALSGNNYLLTKQSSIPIFLYILLFALFLGFRPNKGFVDMAAYTYEYEIGFKMESVAYNWEEEWLWQWILLACQKAGLPATVWFAIIEVGYIGCMFIACKRMIYENVYMAMLFFLASFSFFGFATNVIRNGLACSLFLVALSFLVEKVKKWPVIVALMLAAIGVHRSVLLPCTTSLIALFLIKKPIISIWIWLGSIVASLIAGQSLSQFFAMIDVDERFVHYLNSYEDNKHLYLHTGFRWDFIAYSSVPVILAWIVCAQKKVEDKAFNILATTYILANAVWIICIRTTSTDRFAYLSWFMYPLILAYVFIRMPLYKNQDSVSAWALFLYASFTLFMGLVYYDH